MEESGRKGNLAEPCLALADCTNADLTAHSGLEMKEYAH